MADERTLSELLHELSGFIPLHEAKEIICAAISHPEFPVDLSYLDINFSKVLSEDVTSRARSGTVRRRGGEILQYLTGWAFFHERFYKISNSVLVPRPETECLLRATFDEIEKRKLHESDSFQGFELGVGSGILSIELLLKFPNLKMVGSEISEEARKIAEENFRIHLGENWKERFQWAPLQTQNEWLQPFERQVVNSGKASFFISNPPYLENKPESVTEEVRKNEPHLALFPKISVVEVYRSLNERLFQIVAEGGFGAFEIPHEKAREISKLYQESGFDGKVLNDLSGKGRVLIAARLKIR